MIEEFVRNVLGVKNDQTVEMAVKAASIEYLMKGQHIFREGDTPSAIYFLVDGLFRFYNIDINGKECTDCFVFQSGIPLSPISDFDMCYPCNIQALENSTVLKIPLNLIRQLLREDDDIINLYHHFLNLSIATHLESKNILYKNDAKQRYEWFLEHYQGMVDRIPHMYIASFLNMHPVTLSRLRAKK